MALRYIFLLVIFAVSTSAYRDGARKGVCSSLTPKHGRYMANSSECPYLLSIEPLQNEAEDSILKVTLAGIKEDDFIKGFVVQARDSQNNNLGSFEVIDDTVSQLLTCTDLGVSVSYVHMTFA